MIALIQRVSRADVVVEGQRIAEIGQGLMVLLGVEKGDDQARADRMVHRLLNYRVFEDEQGKMNLGLQQVDGGLLLVPQFTLAADTDRGMRPSFSSAAPPQEGSQWFDYVVSQCQALHSKVGQGRFGADMAVSLVNDGPVTFYLQT